MCCKTKNKSGKHILPFKYKIKYRDNKAMKCTVERFLSYRNCHGTHLKRKVE